MGLIIFIMVYIVCLFYTRSQYMKIRFVDIRDVLWCVIPMANIAVTLAFLTINTQDKIDINWNSITNKFFNIKD